MVEESKDLKNVFFPFCTPLSWYLKIIMDKYRGRSGENMKKGKK
jgi:hypothetical protein